MTKNTKAKKAASSKTYSCSFFSQRVNSGAPAFCVFAASAGDILEWADIERLGPGVKGVQRRENSAKRRQITKFFDDPLNTIPAAVIIALDGSQVSSKNDEVTIPTGRAGRKAGLVIDGQHRLLGISDYDSSIKLPVVAIMNASDEEKAFQFLVINNKGSKVSQNHIKALSLTFKQKILAARLKSAKIALDNDRLLHVDILNTASESPFVNRVDFPTTKGKLKKIVPEAFEKALQHIESLNLPKLEDADIQRDLFVAIWNQIHENWGEAIFVETCKLTEKVGIICMTRYIVDRLAAMADMEEFDLDLSDLKEVARQVDKVLRRQALDFWNAKWKGAGYDTALGHTKVLEALTRMSRNLKDGREWETDIDIL
ncbi:DGQHR domain-containing protein [Cupriavidus sp. Marseille-Q8015]